MGSFSSRRCSNRIGTRPNRPCSRLQPDFNGILCRCRDAFGFRHHPRSGKKGGEFRKERLIVKITFILYAVFSFFAGLIAGFVPCYFLGPLKIIPISAALGFSTALISGYGILFRLPAEESSEWKMGLYAFWPALMPGLTIANIVYGSHPMVIVFSGVLGFLLALILYSRKEFGGKSTA